jgi:hypothetical protein
MQGGWFIRITLLSLTVCAAPQYCSAYETDQFSNRLEPIEDSTEQLDERVNLSIETLESG